MSIFGFGALQIGCFSTKMQHLLPWAPLLLPILLHPQLQAPSHPIPSHPIARSYRFAYPFWLWCKLQCWPGKRSSCPDVSPAVSLAAETQNPIHYVTGGREMEIHREMGRLQWGSGIAICMSCFVSLNARLAACNYQFILPESALLARLGFLWVSPG